VNFLGDLLDPPIIFRNSLVQRFDFPNSGSKASRNSWLRPNRSQQAGIDSCYSCQRPGIELIIFSTTLANQSHVTRMSHDHFVAHLAHLSAYPG